MRLLITFLMLLSLSSQADCVYLFSQHAKYVQSDLKKSNFALNTGAIFLIPVVQDGLAVVPEFGIAASATIGYGSYLLTKIYTEKKKAEAITRIYADARRGYGAYLARFMNDLDPTLEKQQIIDAILKINQTGDLCQHSLASWEDNFYIPDYDEFLDMVKREL